MDSGVGRPGGASRKSGNARFLHGRHPSRVHPRSRARPCQGVGAVLRRYDRSDPARGLYGEGTEALGNLFQISNQTTLGEKEADVLDRLEKVVAEIVKHEQNARLTLLEKNPRMVYDHIGRAYGILANSQVITSKETMNLLSMLSLGIDLGLFEDVTHATVDQLFMDTQPAHLQRNHNNQKLVAEDRDGLRADYIRARLAGVRRPKFLTPPKKHAG
jgi:protein arginine kinase